MLILYGVNDVIHGQGRNAILGAIKNGGHLQENHVVPVLATYPPPTREHRIFGGGVERLNNGIRDLARLEAFAWWTLKEFSVSYDTPSRGAAFPLRMRRYTCLMGCIPTMRVPISWRRRSPIYSEPLAAANKSARLTRPS